MKFNFWQILGLVLIIAGVVLVARKKMGPTDVAPPAGGPAGAPPAATMPDEPSTAPTTEPAAP